MKAFLALITLCCTLPAFAADGIFVPLFNGKDLGGWVQRGGKAEYRIDGDELVGVSVNNTPNTFLCTARNYSDFILEYEFKVDARLNSGVQIRSQCLDTESVFKTETKEIKIPAGRVHGYQVEIDPDVARGRLWSGGIYDEARRGWLFPTGGEASAESKAFSAQGRTLFRANDWNHVRVEAVGGSLRTWVNGVACADIKDTVNLSGFIALQVHDVGKDPVKTGLQVRWRHLRIADLSTPVNTVTEQEKAAGWSLLWDGRSSEGWRSARSENFPAQGWTIADGVLSVIGKKGAESAAGGDIITRTRYSEFELLVDFRLTPGANSGIKYFVQPALSAISTTGTKAAVGSAIGLEYQVLDDALHPDAKLGVDGNRTVASLYDLKAAATTKRPNPIGEWNTARLLVKGPHVEHWLNGQKVLEYDRGTPEFKELVARSKYKAIDGFGAWADGHILLQEHGDTVSYRNLRIRTPKP